jgi:hypothetical protein
MSGQFYVLASLLSGKEPRYLVSLTDTNGQHRCEYYLNVGEKYGKKKQSVTDFIPINGLRRVPPSFQYSVQKCGEPHFKCLFL